MLTISKKLFDSWNVNNISYCHWKSNEHLSDGLNGETDVDVLVSPKDKEKCEDLLQNTGYSKFVSQKGSRYINVDEWLGFDYQTGKLVHIHLHYNILTGMKHVKEYIFPWTDLALNTRTKDKKENVYIISPNMEVIILYVRIVLKANKGNKVKIDNDYNKEIKYLKNKVDLSKVKILCTRLFSSNANLIFNIIRKDILTIKDLALLRKILKKELKNYRVRRFAILLTFKHKYLLYTTKFKVKMNKIFNTSFILKKVPMSKGTSVCFIGSDGSGKSTLSKDINKWLLWKIDSKKFYLGSGEHYKSVSKTLRKYALKLFKSSKNERTKNNYTNKNYNEVYNKKRPSRFFIDLINSYELLRIAKFKFKTLKKADSYIKKGGIALFDRFPQIQFEGIYDGPKIAIRYGKQNSKIISYLARREEIILKKAIHFSPSVVFKLILSPERSIERKPDHSFQEIKTKADITKKLQFNQSRIYVINADQSYEAEILDIKRKIWKEIFSINN